MPQPLSQDLRERAAAAVRDGQLGNFRRLPGKAPCGHWNTITFVAALRSDRIEAPLLLDGPINCASFLAYVEQVLAPTLRPDDLVVADTLARHESSAVRRAVRKAGVRLLLLPRHSPDLNLIEQVLAKLKHLLRKAHARSRGAAYRTIGQPLTTDTPQKHENYRVTSGNDGRHVTTF